MSIAILCGTGAFVEARDTNNVPELPSLEVRGLWSSHDLTEPVATKLLKPRLPKGMVGTEVRMLFRINKKGKPIGIHSYASPFDVNESDLAATMKAVLEWWEFTPPKNKEGQPVEVEVALPVRVVEQGNGNADHYAYVAIPEPILLAVLDK